MPQEGDEVREVDDGQVRGEEVRVEEVVAPKVEKADEVFVVETGKEEEKVPEAPREE